MRSIFMLILQVLTLRLFWSFWAVVFVASVFMAAFKFLRGGHSW